MTEPRSDDEIRADRRSALDAHFARATGRAGSGLADYIQRLRQGHRAVITDGRYTGCACGEIVCGKDLLLAWCDELIVSYAAKVEDFAAETRRATEQRVRDAAEIDRLRKRSAQAEREIQRHHSDKQLLLAEIAKIERERNTERARADQAEARWRAACELGTRIETTRDAVVAELAVERAKVERIEAALDALEIGGPDVMPVLPPEHYECERIVCDLVVKAFRQTLAAAGQETSE